MATLAELLAARETLAAARYDGVRRVRDQNGEEVEYRSDSELRRAIAAIDREIAAAQRAPRSAFRFSTSKGL
ncbi:phage head-tail joining protein [Mangrovicoccus ximenensis]|uniref:phage head-tail joining protein n=1 Tax=Mangrovicoccus ximenensis TaxID=1911570 RepID=UPI000D3A5825|nr:hypothetical protein [Mangrovicoccus ximenensis]